MSSDPSRPPQQSDASASGTNVLGVLAQQINESINDNKRDDHYNQVPTGEFNPELPELTEEALAAQEELARQIEQEEHDALLNSTQLSNPSHDENLYERSYNSTNERSNQEDGESDSTPEKSLEEAESSEDDDDEISKTMRLRKSKTTEQVAPPEDVHDFPSNSPVLKNPVQSSPLFGIAPEQNQFANFRVGRRSHSSELSPSNVALPPEFASSFRGADNFPYVPRGRGGRAQYVSNRGNLSPVNNLAAFPQPRQHPIWGDVRPATFENDRENTFFSVKFGKINNMEQQEFVDYRLKAFLRSNVVEAHLMLDPTFKQELQTILDLHPGLLLWKSNDVLYEKLCNFAGCLASEMTMRKLAELNEGIIPLQEQLNQLSKALDKIQLTDTLVDRIEDMATDIAIVKASLYSTHNTEVLAIHKEGVVKPLPAQLSTVKESTQIVQEPSAVAIEDDFVADC